MKYKLTALQDINITAMVIQSSPEIQANTHGSQGCIPFLTFVSQGDTLHKDDSRDIILLKRASAISESSIEDAWIKHPEKVGDTIQYKTLLTLTRVE